MKIIELKRGAYSLASLDLPMANWIEGYDYGFIDSKWCHNNIQRFRKKLNIGNVHLSVYFVFHSRFS